MNEHASERCVFFFFETIEVIRTKMYIDRGSTFKIRRSKIITKNLNRHSLVAFFIPSFDIDRSVFSEIVVNTYLPPPPPPPLTLSRSLDAVYLFFLCARVVVHRNE